MVVDHDKCGQIAVLAAEPVRHPSAYAGVTHQNHAGVPLVVREHVVIRLADGRVDKRQFVHNRRHVREQLRDPCARLSVLLERKRTLHQRARVALAHDHFAVAVDAGNAGPKRDPVVFFERRLVVERVDVAHSAAHEQVDYRFSSRRKMRRLG